MIRTSRKTRAAIHLLTKHWGYDDYAACQLCVTLEIHNLSLQPKHINLARPRLNLYGFSKDSLMQQGYTIFEYAGYTWCAR